MLLKFFSLLRFTALLSFVCLGNSFPSLANDEILLPLGEKISPRTYLASPQDLSFINQKIEKIHQLLVSTWGSENIDDWAELDGQEQRAYVDARRFLAQKEEASNISLPEVMSVNLYSGFLYQSVNKFLWSNGSHAFESAEQTTAFDAYIRALVSGLNRLPSFEGTVFRSEFSSAGLGHGLTQEELLRRALERYSSFAQTLPQDKNSLYRPEGFMSTTLGSQEEAKKMYVDNALLLLVIESKTGRKISYLSSREYEEEVLFQPGSSFEIIKKEIVEKVKTEEYPFDFQYVIHLREI